MGAVGGAAHSERWGAEILVAKGREESCGEMGMLCILMVVVT